jgi:hypothetical protein
MGDGSPLGQGQKAGRWVAFAGVRVRAKAWNLKAAYWPG